MSQSDERQPIHLHRIAVPCAVHGRHVYYMAGLDHAVDDAAEFLLDTLRDNGYRPEHGCTVMDATALRASLFGGGIDYDDLPY